MVNEEEKLRKRQVLQSGRGREREREILEREKWREGDQERKKGCGSN